MTGNNAAPQEHLLLNIAAALRMLPLMTHRIFLTLFFCLGLAAPAFAECYADYKAKKDGPLRLHYGVIELPDSACGGRRQAAGEISARIGRDGWKLLNVMSTFGKGGLAERKESAGKFYLRY